jgi:hypothetical protein
MKTIRRGINVPRGGKRAGAGRKKGSATKKTRKVADAVAEGGITPLEVMIDAMRRLHKARRYTAAAGVAQHAAPYVHPRLSAVTLRGDQQAPIRLVEELVVVDGDAHPAAEGAARAGDVPPQ